QLVDLDQVSSKLGGWYNTSEGCVGHLYCSTGQNRPELKEQLAIQGDRIVELENEWNARTTEKCPPRSAGVVLDCILQFQQYCRFILVPD
ncbi:hypothetical protein Leryth_005190, partial [Lithospermum erythrorhizon]